MKKILLSLFALLCTMGAWAQIEVSTKIDAPENTYSLCSKNGAYMSVGTGATQYNIGRFAFYKVDGENSYKIFSVDANKWVSYTVAASYSGGANKATLVDTQDLAQKWSVVANASNNGYYNIAPFTSAGAVAGFYWNFHGGAGASGKTYIYDDDKTVGFYDGVNDGGSLWSLEKLTLATQEEIAAAKALVVAGVGYPKTTSSVYQAMNALTFGKSTTKHIELVKDAYIASTDIQLPEDGKTYTLSFFDPVGGEHIIAADGKVGTDKTPGKFYCKVYTNVNEETRYAFVAENGTFFCSHGVSSNYNTYKFGYNDFVINPMVSVTDHVDNSTKQDRFGYVYLLADHRHNKSSDKGSVCLQWSANTYDNSAGAHFENTNSRKYTTAIKMTEVVGNQVSDNVKQIASTITALVTGKKRIGSAIGLYADWAFDSKTGSGYTSFESAVNEAAKTKVVEGYTFSGLNKPETNKFYRLKNYASNNYMSGNADNVKLLTNGADVASTIFYLGENNTLLSYNSGRFLDCQEKGYCAVGTSKSGLVDVAYNGAKANVITYKNNSYWTYGAGGNNANLDRGKDTPNHNGYNWIVSEVTSLPVAIGATGYATFYSPVAVTLPEGLEAYYVSAKTPTSAILTQIENVIPAETAVILKGTAEQTYNLTIGGTANGVENLLSGTIADTYKTEDAYVLSAQGEPAVVGFYKATKNQSNNTAFLNHGFKAYLPVESATARFLSFDFGGNETAIESVESVENNAVVYDLAGRRVQGAQKGIYVVNGKVVIK